MINPAAYAIHHRATLLVAIILVVLGGVLAYGSLGRLEDPEFTIKEAVISTPYPGATAEQVELEVTDPLETAIQQVKQLKEVRSQSRAGLSIIFAEIQETYDKETLPQVWDELRRKVAAAQAALPPGAGPSDINDDFGDVYGVLLAITGDGYTLADLKEIAKDLRRELLLCLDVGRIDLWGLPVEVVYVEVDRAKLSRLGLNPQAIFDAIRHRNTITETGKLAVGSQDVRLRVTGDYEAVKDLGEQLIGSGPDGRLIRLKDIARIERADRDPPDAVLRWNGRAAVGMGISTVSGGDVVAMGDALSQRLEELTSRMPVGIQIHDIANQSKTVKTTVRGFELSLGAAVVIVVGLLLVFMGPREGVIIGAVLLLTILTTFVAMNALGITLQRISLGALIIALGMLVDNAIVVAEGTVIKSQRGMSRPQAAIETVRETQWPLLGATAIAILAFAAITLSKDMTGEWLESLFQVICLSLGLSWIFAITVTPYLCVVLLPGGKSSRGAPHDGPFYRAYRRFVGACIDHRWITLAIVGGLFMTAAWGFGFVRQDFMPDMNRPQITIDVWMPEGTHIDRTTAEVAAIDDHVRSLEGVTDVAAFVGRGPLRFLLTYEPQMPNSAYGQLLVSLDDYRRIPELKARLTPYLERRHPRAITSVDAFKLGPGGGAVVARLSGPDPDVLRDLADRVKDVMWANDNSRSVRTDWGRPVPAQALHLAQARSREIGVTRPDLSEALATTASGVVAGVYRHDEDLLSIIVRPPPDQRRDIDDVRDVQVWSESREHWTPIDQVTDGQSLRWETPIIQRLNRARVVRVSCKQKTGTTDGLLRELMAPIESIPLPDGYTLEWGGEHEEQVEANTKLMSNVPIAFTAMFVVSVMLFNTLRHALIIFLGLPLAVIGVASGMLLADKPFGFMAMLGFLGLAGMLIKNEIVLLDQINIERAAGKVPHRAVVDAAVGRVRPVSMAALTTVLGMTPLLWDAFFAPMAVTIMGGLTFATVLTLVVVPVLYSAFFGVRREVDSNEKELVPGKTDTSGAGTEAAVTPTA